MSQRRTLLFIPGEERQPILGWHARISRLGSAIRRRHDLLLLRHQPKRDRRVLLGVDDVVEASEVGVAKQRIAPVCTEQNPIGELLLEEGKISEEELEIYRMKKEAEEEEEYY